MTRPGDPGDSGTPNPPGGKPIVIDDPKILDDPIEPDGGELVLPDGSVPEPPPGLVRVVTRYIVAHGKYLAKIVQEGASPAQTYFLHTDMLGSIRAITDSVGQVAARFDYEPFGLLIEESSPASAGGGEVHRKASGRRARPLLLRSQILRSWAGEVHNG
ncbi:MAG: hypothetical protein BWY92_01554 [Firmicutes bacterium ADurb.BinA052]|nr:MAG: hypothetical protein BWY92_01554 [Firmicutes bacterium ADurb.BinA052]